jgi:hypothetical protein
MTFNYSEGEQHNDEKHNDEQYNDEWQRNGELSDADADEQDSDEDDVDDEQDSDEDDVDDEQDSDEDDVDDERHNAEQQDNQGKPLSWWFNQIQAGYARNPSVEEKDVWDRLFVVCVRELLGLPKLSHI